MVSSSALEPIGLLKRNIPLGDVLRWALLGNEERLTAETAMRLGIVTEIVPRADLWERAHELAAEIASRRPEAIQGSVRAIWESLDMTRSAALQNGILFTHIGNPSPSEKPALGPEAEAPVPLMAHLDGSGPWEQRLGFWWIAEDHPDRLAIAASPDGVCTYAELAGRAHQLVHLLRARGVRPGDAVAALLPNGIGLVEWWLACSEAGWYFIPLNTFLTEHEIGTIVEHSGARGPGRRRTLRGAGGDRRPERAGGRVRGR